MTTNYTHLQLCSKILKAEKPTPMIAKSVDANTGKTHEERAYLLHQEIKSTYKKK
jgi:hypothetical protein